MLDANDLFQKIIKTGIFAEVPNGPAKNAIKPVSVLSKGGVRIIEVDIRSSEGMQISQKLGYY